jgi:hypothetical protein
VLDPSGHARWVTDQIEAVAARERRQIDARDANTRFWGDWQRENQDIAPFAGEIATRMADAIIYENGGRRPADEGAFRRQIADRTRARIAEIRGTPGAPAATRTGGTLGPSGAAPATPAPKPEPPPKTYAQTLWDDRERVSGLNGGKYW